MSYFNELPNDIIYIILSKMKLVDINNIIIYISQNNIIDIDYKYLLYYKYDSKFINKLITYNDNNKDGIIPLNELYLILLEIYESNPIYKYIENTNIYIEDELLYNLIYIDKDYINTIHDNYIVYKLMNNESSSYNYIETRTYIINEILLSKYKDELLKCEILGYIKDKVFDIYLCLFYMILKIEYNETNFDQINYQEISHILLIINKKINQIYNMEDYDIDTISIYPLITKYMTNNSITDAIEKFKICKEILLKSKNDNMLILSMLKSISDYITPIQI